MLLAALPMLMVSCGEDGEMTVTPSNTTIKTNEVVTLTCSDKNATWASENVNIAEVGQTTGEVKGMHIGTVNIIATSKDGSETATSLIRVEAANNNFETPYLDWGNSLAAVENKMNTWTNYVKETLPESLAANSLVYSFDDASGYPMYSYGFDNNQLIKAMLAVTEDQDMEGDLQSWVEERYWLSATVNNFDILFDTEKESDATMVIRYGYDTDLDCMTVSWTPYGTSTKANVKGNVADAAREALRHVLGK